MLFGHDLTFWLAVLGATLIKLFTGPYHSLPRAVVTVFAAVFSAYFFTEPVLHYLEFDPEVYSSAVAALLALTGEGLVRLLIQAINDPSKALDWLKVWRSGK